MPQILITVTVSGQTMIETKGYVGSSCTDATKTMEAALGNKTSDRPTAERHLPTPE